MELKYFEGSQQIQKQSIVESVTDSMVIQVHNLVTEAEERAKRYPRVHHSIVFYVPAFKGRHKRCEYTVICE